MTNTTKWLIAIPFSILIALIIPATITGNLLWFIGRWADTLYVILTTSMWLIATAFVDVSKQRIRPDQANRLISVSLIFSVPISVADGIYLSGSIMPNWMPILGMVFCTTAIGLGIWARTALGDSYSPRGKPAASNRLVRNGPYRWVRHPVYTSACIWAFSWPLLVSSVIGASFTCVLVVAAVLRRITDEEEALIRNYGEGYIEYQKSSWRLIPYIY